MCMYQPLYEPPTPTVLTVIQKKKGDQRERGHQREESDWFESPNRDNMCSQEGTQFRDPEAQVNSRCSRMGAWASHSVRRVRSCAMCMYRPLYEPPTPMVLTAIQRKRKATRERGHQREESDWFESPNRDNMCSQEGTQFRDPEAQPLYEPPTPMVLTAIQRKRKATRERINERRAIGLFESPNRDNMCSQEGTQFRDPEAQLSRERERRPEREAINERRAIGLKARTGTTCVPRRAHSSGTRRHKLTADVRGWEPGHPTVFDVYEAAQCACIVRRVRSRAMCMYRPLYEPPTPMVLTVIQKKRKAIRVAIKSRRAIDSKA
ncbi:hypothetical protein JOM56_012931 [Amanita muscaria]